MAIITWSEFGPMLREMRKQNGWSQQELAFRLGYDRGHIARLEGGKRKPSKHFLHALSLVCQPQAPHAHLLNMFHRMLEYRSESLNEDDILAFASAGRVRQDVAGYHD